MRELSLHILDVLENGIEAGATRVAATIEEDREADTMRIEIDDNGRGMPGEVIEKVTDPFYTTRKTRHVGLGLPLFAAAARRCDGGLIIQSELGKGTRIIATFRASHIDRAPLGDIPSAILAVLLSGRPVEVAYTHRVDDEEFRFDSSEIQKELGDVPLTHPRVRSWVLQFLREGEASLHTEASEKHRAVMT
jgi:hypothetical protein